MAQSAASDQQNSQVQQAQNSAAQQQQAPQRPAYVPEKYWNAEKGEVLADPFAKEVNDLIAFKTEQEVRKQSLPGSADKYEVKLPDGFKPPEGFQFSFDANSPDLAEARKTAHELGLDQAGFSRMLGVYAANKIGELQKVNAARDAELGKLGSTAMQRIDQVATWMQAKVGDKAAPLVAALKQYPVAATVDALEGVIHAFTTQGGTSFNQQHREQQEPQGKIPGYDGMSFQQRRMAQMNQKAAGGGM